MKKLVVVISLAVVLGLVLVGCPQPTDGGETPAPVETGVFGTLESANVGTLIGVKGGEFARGGTDITVSNFYLAETEVTQAQWVQVMPGKPNPSNFTTDPNLPVENITWYDAIAFCNALSAAEGLTEFYTVSGENVTVADWKADGYRLPTEAEWEYAAGGGRNEPRTIYAGTSEDVNDPEADNLGEYAWYSKNAVGTTHIVGTAGRTESAPAAKTGNANVLGLYDMSGNVWEWCWDWYVHPYEVSETDNPKGPDSGSKRIYRGGSWGSDSSLLPVAQRSSIAPSEQYDDIGFRVARSVAP